MPISVRHNKRTIPVDHRLLLTVDLTKSVKKIRTISTKTVHLSNQHENDELDAPFSKAPYTVTQTTILRSPG